MDDIRCPHCNSEDFDYIDNLDGEYKLFKNTEGKLLDNYKCNRCHNFLQIEIKFNVTDMKVHNYKRCL